MTAAASGFRESSTPNTAQRVKQMEKQLSEVRTRTIPAIYQQLMGNFNQLQQGVVQRLTALEEILAVLVDELGASEVEARIQARRLSARVADVDRSKQAITEGLEKALLLPVESVAEDSLIVGFETDSSGVAQNPAFSSLPFAQLSPHLKAPFLGAKVGDKIEIDDGGSFTIEAVYKVDKQKIEAAAAAERESALKAATEPPPEVLEAASEG